MPSSSPAQPPTPLQGAQAQALSQAGGEMLNIGSMPEQAYAEALDQIAFNPIFQQSQSATQANSALANAKTNQAVESAVNPYGTMGQNAFNKEAATRLTGVMNQPYTPGTTQTNTNGIYQYPTNSEMPNFQLIMDQANQIAKALPTLNMTPNSVSLETNTPSNADYSNWVNYQPPQPPQLPYYYS